MRQEAGFTLTELLVTMGIVVILLAIGTPSYRYVTTTNRLSAEINGLLGDLQYARSEAVREGQNVTVCPLDVAQTQCAAMGSAWGNGWVVWADLNNNNQVDNGEILRQQAGFSSGDTMTVDNANLSGVVFNREGFATGMGQATTFVAKDSTQNPTYTHCLQVTIVGMASTMTPATDTTATCN
jgi:type IV fimbrial biogenesis protein FimT